MAMPSRYILDTAVQSSGIMGRTVISLIFPILTGAAVLRFPLIACAISLFSIAESAANHNGNLFTSDRAECPESEYPAPGSAEITTHGFCGQICFDNTGGCDTIKAKLAGNVVLTAFPAFSVTNLLLVQCSSAVLQCSYGCIRAHPFPLIYAP